MVICAIFYIIFLQLHFLLNQVQNSAVVNCSHIVDEGVSGFIQNVGKIIPKLFLVFMSDFLDESGRFLFGLVVGTGKDAPG